MRVATLAATAVCSLLLAGVAHADEFVFLVSLDGSQEVPPSGSSGTGTATLTVDDVTGEVTISGTFTGLGSNVNGAHLHGLAPPGEEAGILIGLSFSGTTSGTFGGSGTLNSTNLQGLFDELTYLNVHSVNLPGGEIRGQVLVPEPATAGVLGGALALALLRRRR